MMRMLIALILLVAPAFSQVVTIDGKEKQKDSLSKINGNFSWLNTNKPGKSDVEPKRPNELTFSSGPLFADKWAAVTAINNYGASVGYSCSSLLVDDCHAWYLPFGSSNAIDIGTVGGVNAQARALTDAGTIAGVTYDAQGSSTVWVRTSEGTVTNLGTLGMSNLSVLDMNDAGDILGQYSNQDGTSGYWLRKANGVFTNIGAVYTTHVMGLGRINASGQIIGTSWDGSTAASRRSWLRSPSGSYTELTSIMNEAWDANDSGVVVGSLPVGNETHSKVFYADGTSKDLGTVVSGMKQSHATCISNSGIIGGYSWNTNDSIHAWIITPDGVSRDLGTLGSEEALLTLCADDGTVAGVVGDSDGTYQHPFILPGTLAKLPVSTSITNGLLTQTDYSRLGKLDGGTAGQYAVQTAPGSTGFVSPDVIGGPVTLHEYIQGVSGARVADVAEGSITIRQLVANIQDVLQAAAHQYIDESGRTRLECGYDSISGAYCNAYDSSGHNVPLKLNGDLVFPTRVSSSNPGCAASADIGKTWFDTTTTMTAYKVCVSTAGVVGWVTK